MDSRLIRIAENGAFVGKVSIDIAEIHGSFEGELTARSQLIIHSTGRVSGTIRFGKLVVEEGGELNGEISVISAKAPPQARPLVEPYVALSAAAG
jgi:cytoskeletal protein CcmA (bactofilin family)